MYILDSISHTDDIQDVIARKVGGKVTFSAGEGVVRPVRPLPLGYGAV